MLQRELIYGTGNPSKLKSMRRALAPLGITVIGVRELGIPLPEVDESGNTPLENARIKALAYFDVLQRPVFSCDSGLYVDGLPDAEQPGVHIRMVNGRRLDDDELLQHFIALAWRLGGRAKARYLNGICVVMSATEIYEHFGEDISGNVFYLVTTPHQRREEGFPLDSISVDIASGSYYYDSVRPEGDVGIAEMGFRAYFRSILDSI